MLFIKYITDKYGNSSDFASPVTIPKGASFKDMIALKGKSDIGDKINTQIIQPLIDANARLVDQRGIRHSVAVYANTVLEAAAAGLKQIRETEMIGDDGVEDLTVDIKTATSHKVPLFKLKAWLESSGRDPREAALKSKLR